MEKENIVMECVEFIERKLKRCKMKTRKKTLPPAMLDVVADAESMLNVAHYAGVWDEVVKRISPDAKTILGFSGERPDDNCTGDADG